MKIHPISLPFGEGWGGDKTNDNEHNIKNKRVRKRSHIHF